MPEGNSVVAGETLLYFVRYPWYSNYRFSLNFTYTTPSPTTVISPVFLMVEHYSLWNCVHQWTDPNNWGDVHTKLEVVAPVKPMP